MTNQASGEHEEQWQQPPFAASGSADPTPVEPDVVQGRLMVPASKPPPPSLAETALNSLSGIVWPVMIVLAIAQVVGWWPAILIAIVTSSVLGTVGNHLKARRKALGS